MNVAEHDADARLLHLTQTPIQHAARDFVLPHRRQQLPARMSKGKSPRMGDLSGMGLVIFRLEDQRYALDLAAVERVVRSVEITPLPGAPDIIIGAINVAGRVLPVLDVRRRLGLSQREPGLTDQFVIAESKGRSIVFVVDETEGVVERPHSAIAEATDLAPGLERFAGIVQLDGRLVLIHDAEAFLTPDESLALDAVVVAQD